MNFEDYWERVWVPSGMPMAFDLAMKEIAEKAWNAALKGTKDHNSSQDSLIKFVRSNVDNDRLSDAEFRQVIWNTFKDVM